MKPREDLSAELRSVLGSNNVYFQKPENFKRSYPCIEYSRENVDTKYADNIAYNNMQRYELTVMDKNPDSTIAYRLLQHFRYCRISRSYTSDGIHHDALVLYY